MGTSLLEEAVPPSWISEVGPHCLEVVMGLDSVCFSPSPDHTRQLTAVATSPAGLTAAASAPSTTAHTTHPLRQDSFPQTGLWVKPGTKISWRMLPFSHGSPLLMKEMGYLGVRYFFKKTDYRSRGCSEQHLGTALRARHARSHLLTIHLQDVGLEQLLVAGGMAGVIAHVDGGHLGDVEGVVLSEVLHRARKTTWLASLLRSLGRAARPPGLPGKQKRCSFERFLPACPLSCPLLARAARAGLGSGDCICPLSLARPI